MLATERLANGTDRIKEILTDLEKWMVEFEYESVLLMRGSMSQRNVAYEHANYMKVLQSFKL
jgi:dihydroorotate dehydrogenase (fumarate)